MSITVTPTNGACGARVEGVNLSESLTETTVDALRQAWLQHHVLVFPDQLMSEDDLERFTGYFGGFGDDPFIAPLAGREHIIAVCRSADEQAPVFAENWHTDWSFQKVPPAGTCLYGITIPPVGGDTGFINQHQALADMPADLRDRLEGKMAVHSATGAYSRDGLYGEKDQDSDRSMTILYADEARETQLHPIIRKHPETGEEGVFGCVGYIVGIDGMADDKALELLLDLHAWQTREEFQYRHQWSENMLVMWDNRSVLHRANGGYDGYARLLHRTTIADSK